MLFCLNASKRKKKHEEIRDNNVVCETNVILTCVKDVSVCVKNCQTDETFQTNNTIECVNDVRLCIKRLFGEKNVAIENGSPNADSLNLCELLEVTHVNQW